jgi:repressor LexA
MDLQSLSERQRAILKFIQQWSNDHGYPPTIREIGKAVRINSTSVVNYNLNKLVKEGYISRSKDVSRGIRLKTAMQEMPVNVVGDGSGFRPDVMRVPMVGQIVAGQPAPIPGDDFGYYFDEEEAIPVPRMLIGNNDPSRIYALKVHGQSMIDAMISEDDIVVLKRQEIANNGEMVAVWLNERGETTLKHFFDEGERIRLQPANPTMDPIYVDKDKVQIQGKVLAVLRRLD